MQGTALVDVECIHQLFLRSPLAATPHSKVLKSASPFCVSFLKTCPSSPLQLSPALLPSLTQPLAALDAVMSGFVVLSFHLKLPTEHTATFSKRWHIRGPLELEKHVSLAELSLFHLP